MEEEDEDEEEAEDDERDRKRRKMERARLKVRVIQRERSEKEEEDEEDDKEEVGESQGPLEHSLEWLQNHTNIVAWLSDRADFCYREMYNVQVSINNNLVLLNRNVERWMRRGGGR